ncbi:MAG TPA: SDR family oxidoreductase [Marmoricola sp.]|nr:SDR family oxidoreductase [Marmoricola sp.]
MLALTGATGHVGGLVAARVADLQPRLVVRDPSRAPAGFDVRVCTYDDHAASVSALQGVDVLFMVSASESATRRAEHRTFVRAAADAGVRHVVYTSFLGAAPDAGFALARDHFDCERAIGESGMAATFLRDNFYLDVLARYCDAAGVYRGPAGSGRVSGVARADVADVAAAVLRSPDRHVGSSYDLTGAEALTFAEIAARTGAVLGRQLRYVEETVEEAYASRRAGWPDAAQWQLDAWVSTYTAIRDGELERISPDVERLTGHPPRRLEDVLTTG